MTTHNLHEADESYHRHRFPTGYLVQKQFIFYLFYLPLGDVDEREEFLEKSFVYRQLERQQAELFGALDLLKSLGNLLLKRRGSLRT